jgi:hypothetical protein
VDRVNPPLKLARPLHGSEPLHRVHLPGTGGQENLGKTEVVARSNLQSHFVRNVADRRSNPCMGFGEDAHDRVDPSGHDLPAAALPPEDAKALSQVEGKGTENPHGAGLGQQEPRVAEWIQFLAGSW